MQLEYGIHGNRPVVFPSPSPPDVLYDPWSSTPASKLLRENVHKFQIRAQFLRRLSLVLKTLGTKDPIEFEVVRSCVIFSLGCILTGGIFYRGVI